MWPTRRRRSASPPPGRPRRRRLAAAFWPGPLTVIVPRAPGVAQAAAGGQDSIGLRCPAHPVAQALLRAALRLGVPGVAAPSANRFGRVSPTRAAHVVQEFGADAAGAGRRRLPGRHRIGHRRLHARRSRRCCAPGMLPRAQLEAVLGMPLREPDASSPRACGTLESHYAPRARVRLMSAAAVARRARTAGAAGAEPEAGGIFPQPSARPGAASSTG